MEVERPRTRYLRFIRIYIRKRPDSEWRALHIRSTVKQTTSNEYHRLIVVEWYIREFRINFHREGPPFASNDFRMNCKLHCRKSLTHMCIYNLYMARCNCSE